RAGAGRPLPAARPVPRRGGDTRAAGRVTRMNVQELADRVEIVELVARCLIAVDDKDWDAVAACYTEDARIDFGGRIGPVDGSGKVAEVLRRTLETVDVTQHLVTNSVVRLDGDHATHVAYVHAQHQRGDDFYTVGCRYEDRLIR